MIAACRADWIKDDLAREEQVLQELQHRDANSLQIIGVRMQSARKVHFEAALLHLHEADRCMMSIATLQRQVAASRIGEVELNHI